MKKSNLSLSSVTNAFRYGSIIHPVRDWLVLLASAFVLLSIGVAWNLWLFVQLENGKTLGSGSSPIATSTAASVTAVQQVFQKRATEENAYQNTLHFADPSLQSSGGPAVPGTSASSVPAATTTTITHATTTFVAQ